ncbi:Protein fam98a [Homalodisca vitripennis]|nr:Protein fam98a [Homalodisca vitripennis]
MIDSCFLPPKMKQCLYDKINSEKLESAIAEGPKSVEYTRLVEWLSKELKFLCSLDEHVNAITSADDSSSFLLEVSSFLKELGCQYTILTEGNVNQRLQTRGNRLLLLDFLLSELQAARMVRSNKPDPSSNMEVTLQESSTAADLKNLLIALTFPKPPANITPEILFGKVLVKMKEITGKVTPARVGKPIFTGVLSDKQWHQIQELQTELHKEYRMRREMLLKRLDVTIQSFQWSERLKNQQDRVVAVYGSKRNAMKVEPNVDLADLLAARDDLAILEKTSNASVRKNTQSSINKVMIGMVPDRGGRPSEQQAPPPEMPSWQQRPGNEQQLTGIGVSCLLP